MSAEDFVKLSVTTYAELAAAGISEKAELAFYRGIQLSGGANLHGVVPRTLLPSIGPPRVATELVDRGFWEPMPTGWRYRSWDKWQAELEQMHVKRAKDAERQRNKRRRDRAKELGLEEFEPYDD